MARQAKRPATTSADLRAQILSDFAAMKMPEKAHPNPDSAAISGTSSMPQLGFSPNTTATSIGTHP